jgi:hypothetical protein
MALVRRGRTEPPKSPARSTRADHPPSPLERARTRGGPGAFRSTDLPWHGSSRGLAASACVRSRHAAALASVGRYLTLTCASVISVPIQLRCRCHHERGVGTDSSARSVLEGLRYFGLIYFGLWPLMLTPRIKQTVVKVIACLSVAPMPSGL